MSNLLNLIGLITSIIGTVILIQGTLKTASAIIKKRWADVIKDWENTKPSYVYKRICCFAKKIGSDDPLDTEDCTIHIFVMNILTFGLLFFGFLLQIISVIISIANK
ncbi:MAG: hypothetical protein WC539_08145 [Nitrospirota bacterium]